MFLSADLDPRAARLQAINASGNGASGMGPTAFWCARETRDAQGARTPPPHRDLVATPRDAPDIACPQLAPAGPCHCVQACEQVAWRRSERGQFCAAPAAGGPGHGGAELGHCRRGLRKGAADGEWLLLPATLLPQTLLLVAPTHGAARLHKANPSACLLPSPLSRRCCTHTSANGPPLPSLCHRAEGLLRQCCRHCKWHRCGQTCVAHYCVHPRWIHLLVETRRGGACSSSAVVAANGTAAMEPLLLCFAYVVRGAGVQARRHARIGCRCLRPDAQTPLLCPLQSRRSCAPASAAPGAPAPAPGRAYASWRPSPAAPAHTTGHPQCTRQRGDRPQRRRRLHGRSAQGGGQRELRAAGERLWGGWGAFIGIVEGRGQCI